MHMTSISVQILKMVHRILSYVNTKIRKLQSAFNLCYLYTTGILSYVITKIRKLKSAFNLWITLHFCGQRLWPTINFEKNQSTTFGYEPFLLQFRIIATVAIFQIIKGIISWITWSDFQYLDAKLVKIKDYFCYF